MTAKILWLVIIIWLILFFIIRETFKFSGNPIVSFMIMLVLFFMVLFFVRVSVVRLRIFWGNLRRSFNRFFSKTPRQ
jgi:hypothetical protein